MRRQGGGVPAGSSIKSKNIEIFLCIFVYYLVNKNSRHTKQGTLKAKFWGVICGVLFFPLYRTYIIAFVLYVALYVSSFFPT